MHAVALTQLHLENDLQRALERDEFRVYYQPILNLQTLQIEGLEALIRWQHPETGMIAPSEFIPVAEETGLITEIDLWVLKEAAHQMLLWQQELPHLSELALSVNLSGKHFSRGRLVSQIDEILLLSGMRPANLRIEITEGVLIDNAVIAAQVLGELRSRKIRVCLDDFGTQYSSLSYLHRFPINCLKVDKLFIASLEEDLDKREIVKAIIGLALNLQMSVVAEGIESASQLEFLQSIDCHAGQGYYFSPPLNSSATSELLRSGHLC
jgi:EAL domain-containing protein (putative c-di-GMP-specific phosphodiesterase class I)